MSLHFIRTGAYAGLERAGIHGRSIQTLEMADSDREDSTDTFPEGLTADDADAFRRTFERFCRPVFTFIVGMVGDGALAEDLTQETFVRAFRGLKTLRHESRISTWIFGIARNVAREALRRRRVHRNRLNPDESGCEDLPDFRVTQDRAMMDAELHGKVQRAVAGLPEDQRLVFVLKIVNRMRYEEIARITGASVAKLKTDLHRARLAMRRSLAPYVETHLPGSRGGQ